MLVDERKRPLALSFLHLSGIGGSQTSGLTDSSHVSRFLIKPTIKNVKGMIFLPLKAGVWSKQTLGLH